MMAYFKPIIPKTIIFFPLLSFFHSTMEVHISTTFHSRSVLTDYIEA